MKDNPSSPALSIQGDASDHPEGVSKEALANTKASGHPKVISIREMERKIPKILRVRKEVAEFRISLGVSAEEVGEIINAFEENGYQVEAKNPTTFIVYKVFLSVI